MIKIDKPKVWYIVLTVMLIALILVTLFISFINLTYKQTLYYSNGKTKYQGEMQAGLPQGEGVIFNPKGSKLVIGEFHKGDVHGFAKLKNNEFNYEGFWKNGYFSGQGTLYIQDQVAYEGNWKLGVPNGEGRLYNKENRKIFEGLWLNGVPVEGNFYRPNGTKFSDEANNSLLTHVGTNCIELLVNNNQLNHKLFFKNTANFTEGKIHNVYNLEKIIEKKDVSDNFKKTLYLFIEYSGGELNDYQHSLQNIIKDLDNVPIDILQELVRLGINLRFITGSISDQPEFYNNMPLNVGTITSELSGVTSTKHRLAVVRLDRENATCIALHELGHLVDYFLFDDISGTAQFQKICSEEAEKVFSCCTCDLSYYTDNCAEYFAEFFATYYVDAENKRNHMPECCDITKVAPKTNNLFANKIDNFLSVGYHYNPKLAAFLDKNNKVKLLSEYKSDNCLNLYTICKNLDWVIQLDWPYNQITDTIATNANAANLSTPLSENVIGFMVTDNRGNCFFNKAVISPHPPIFDCKFSNEILPINRSFFNRSP
ncbi:hypothetical protein PRVXT_002105 [Proteinivorax tanatarense]|uniref:ATLF-like domain-containing protein n=1 Tax=Proteinivorax tanatarense TaxID=1260629 RepID=A0AAU7VJR7_9FIRM